MANTLSPEDDKDSSHFVQQHSTVTGDGNTIILVAGSDHKVIVSASYPFLYLYRYTTSSGGSNLAFERFSPYTRSTRFVGRDSALTDLQAWLASDRRISVRVIAGGAGIGKTRLAIELAAVAESMGWHAGFLRTTELERFLQQPNARDWARDRSTLAIVDYASQKADALRRWLDILQDACDSPSEIASQKLRLILLDRSATSQSGWWTRAFGRTRRWSDKRSALLDSAEPLILEPFADEGLCMSIIEDALKNDPRLSNSSLSRILSDIRASPHAAQLLGNPLMTQIAAADTINSLESRPQRTRDSLLAQAVERERSLMRSEWELADVPDYAFSGLEKLIATITLLGGASLESIFSIVDSVSTFVPLVAAVGKGKIPTLLSSVLRTDKIFGMSPIEPDMFGEIFVAESDLPADAIAHIFRINHFAAGRMWRLLSDFKADESLQRRGAEWVKALVSEFASDTVALDVILRDNDFEQTETILSAIADAQSRISRGLREGSNTTASLLVGPAGREGVIAHSLVLEARYLGRSKRFNEALQKVREAKSISAIDSITRVQAMKIEIECLNELSMDTEKLAAIDEAISYCRKKVDAPKRPIFDEFGFAHNLVRQFIEGDLNRLESRSHRISTLRGLEMILQFGSIKDLRLEYAALILQRIYLAGVSSIDTIEAIEFVNKVIDEKIYDRLIDVATFCERCSRRYDGVGRIEESSALVKAVLHFERSAEHLRSNALYLICR
jgi:hypothetical protein